MGHIGLNASDGLWNLLYLYSTTPADDGLRFDANLRFAEKEKTKRKVLFIGASVTREDFATAVLNEGYANKGLRFFNLGISGNGNPLLMSMLAGRIIESDPSLIVYTPFIGSIYREFAYRGFQLYFQPEVIFKLYDAFGFKELWQQRSLLSEGAIGYFSAFYRHRHSFHRIIPNIITSSMSGKVPKRPQQYAYHRPKSAGYFGQLIKQHKDNPRFIEHRFVSTYRQEFLDMCQKIEHSHVPFIVMQAPTHPKIHQVYNPELDDKVAEFFREINKECKFDYVETSSLPEFFAEDFIDFTHLNEQGRVKFTKEFIKILSDKMKEKVL